MIRFSPLAEHQKQETLNSMFSCAHPILADPTVFVLMLMITIFNDENKPEIGIIQQQYWTMLRRYLITNNNYNLDLEDAVNIVQNCLARLPGLGQPFSQF